MQHVATSPRNLSDRPRATTPDNMSERKAVIKNADSACLRLVSTRALGLTLVLSHARRTH
jgi:hypothetical protein